MRFLRFLTCGVLLASVLVAAKQHRHGIPAALESEPTTTLEYLDGAQAIRSTNPRNQQIEPLCRLHKIAMSKRTVPIVYGLTEFTKYGEELARAAEVKFPNAKDNVLGGCIPSFHKDAFVWTCDECQREKLSWRAAHPTK